MANIHGDPPRFEPGQPTGPHTLYLPDDEPIAGLPPTVTEKVLRIREIAETRHRAIPETIERQAINQAKGDAQRRLDRLLNHPHDGGFGLDPVTDMRVIMQRRVLADATVAAERLDARYQIARQEFQVAARTRSAIDVCLRNRRHGTAFTEYLAEPKLLKNEDILGAVSRLERRARELRADLHRCESAPYPLNHARARLVELIERLAQAPNVSALIEHEHGEIWWPTRSVQSQVMNVNADAGRPIAFTEVPDALAVLLWAMKDTLIKQCETLLAEEADDGAALSIAERQTQAAQIAGDLLAVEHDAAAMIWAGLDQKLPVWFDADMNAMAIIGAQLETRLATNGR
jgi:hypothetical protein